MVAGSTRVGQWRRSTGGSVHAARSHRCLLQKRSGSVCTTHALQFIDTAQSGEVPHVHVTILRRNTFGALEVADERYYRQ